MALLGISHHVAKATCEQTFQQRSKTDLSLGHQQQTITATWEDRLVHIVLIQLTLAHVLNFWQRETEFMDSAPAVGYGPLCFLTINGSISYDYLKLFFRLLNSWLSQYVATSSNTFFLTLQLLVPNQPSQNATVCPHIWRKKKQSLPFFKLLTVTEISTGISFSCPFQYYVNLSPSAKNWKYIFKLFLIICMWILLSCLPSPFPRYPKLLRS